MTSKFQKVAIFLCFFVVLMMSVFYLFSTQGNRKNTILPLKCKAFSEINMETEYGTLNFSIIENLQLYDGTRGLLQFEGYLKNGSERTYLERTVYIKDAKPAGDDSFVFSVEKTNRSKLDNTRDELFNQMWLELAGNDELLNISVRPMMKNVYTIISPYSPQFSCVAY